MNTPGRPSRRQLVGWAGAVLLPTAGAGTSGVPTLAVLDSFADPDDGRVYRRVAKALGYRDADAMRIGVRGLLPAPESAAAVARELLAARPAAFLTIGDDGIRAAMAATETTPIVAMGYDLVGSGFVRSLRQPGGNVTGISLVSNELDSKRLQLLTTLLPAAASVLVVGSTPALTQAMPGLLSAAQQLGVSIRTAEVSTPAGIDSALQLHRPAEVAGVLVLYSDFLVRHVQQLGQACAKARVPMAHPFPEMAEQAGGVIGYGPDFNASLRQLVRVLIRVLQGERPARVPVEQPVRYAMVLDLNRCRALGISVPASLLARADRVIG